MSRLINFPSNLGTYVAECDRAVREHPGHASRLRFLREFPTWYSLFISGSSPIDSEIPWITIGAANYLTNYINNKMKVFEYGCGGSTLFFAKHASHVISVDHDPFWAGIVRAKLIEKNLDTRVDLRIAEIGNPGSAPKGDPADPDVYTSSDFPERSLANYVKTIDSLMDDAFDIVMVDGRARPACIKHAVSKVRLGGLMIVDNTERSYYWPAIRRYTSGFRMHDFPGPCPFLSHFTRTTVWKRELDKSALSHNDLSLTVSRPNNENSKALVRQSLEILMGQGKK
jgi:predicted O-methyltransferase YrrM